MADKMIRMAGRDNVDGTARPIGVTVDADGNHALRIIDAAPFAYDGINDRYSVQVENIPDTRIIGRGMQILGEYIDNALPVTKQYTWYGFGTAHAVSDVVPFDISDKPKQIIYIENNLSVSVAVSVYHYMFNNGNPGSKREYTSSTVQNLAAGGKFLLTPFTFASVGSRSTVLAEPILAVPSIGMCIKVDRGSTAPTGTITIQVLAGGV